MASEARSHTLSFGTWQREDEASNLIAAKLEDLSPLFGRLAASANVLPSRAITKYRLESRHFCLGMALPFAEYRLM